MTPLHLSIFYNLFDLDIEKAQILHIAQQVTEEQFIPIITGLLLRSVLAVACVARNIALAVFIITLSENSAPFIPTLVSYLILGAIVVVAIPYSTWSKRQLAKQAPNT